MIRIIFLLSPVFVSFFWAMTLAGDKKRQSIPRAYLAKFMLFPMVCFAFHFLYFAPLPNVYPYFDVPLQIIGNLIFPIFYIYFRLLTVDKKFSLNTHGIYLVIPSIIPLLSAVAVYLTPWHEFTTWLYDKTAFSDSPYIHALIILRKLLNMQFLIIVVATFIGSYLLLKKYGAKAEQYYSDIKDGKYNNAMMLSLIIALSCVASFIALAVGRYLIMPKDAMIYPLWTIFSVSLYLIGYMGLKQKPVNPTFDLEEQTLDFVEDATTQFDKKVAHQKILELFENDKIYLNNQLNIMDVANAVGTNRTYISVLINMYYNQNFCTFVNAYRIAEMEKVIYQNPTSSYDLLMQSCGFGSVNSMKRSVSMHTGMPISEWKKQLVSTQSKA